MVIRVPEAITALQPQLSPRPPVGLQLACHCAWLCTAPQLPSSFSDPRFYQHVEEGCEWQWGLVRNALQAGCGCGVVAAPAAPRLPAVPPRHSPRHMRPDSYCWLI